MNQVIQSIENVVSAHKIFLEAEAKSTSSLITLDNSEAYAKIVSSILKVAKAAEETPVASALPIADYSSVIDSICGTSIAFHNSICDSIPKDVPSSFVFILSSLLSL